MLEEIEKSAMYFKRHIAFSTIFQNAKNSNSSICQHITSIYLSAGTMPDKLINQAAILGVSP
jgi:hypothetical protein